jgi:hypothetical protein
MQPIWKPQNPSQFGERFYFFSPRLGRFVYASSKLEYERALLLEFDATVTMYCEQPCEATAFVTGRLGRSRFDYWVEYSDGQGRFEEVKYLSELRDPASRAHRQIAIQKAWCRTMGYAHAIVTDAEIWKAPILLCSLRTLLHEYDVRYPKLVGETKECEEHILNMVERCDGIQIHEVVAKRPSGIGEDIQRLALMDLVRSRRVDAGIEHQALNPRSMLRSGRITI